MSISYQQDRHDVGLKRDDGTTLGMMLIRDKYDTPIYQVDDDEYLARHQTEVAGYDALPPEKEFAIVQDDHRSGFGLETYDEDDSKRYNKSIGMDMRHRGMGILSYGATGISLPATHAEPTYVVLNPSFPDWTSGAPNNWTESTGHEALITEEATIKKDTSSSCAIDAEDGSNPYVEQAFSDPTEWIGYDITLTAWGYQESANGWTDGELELYRNGAKVGNAACGAVQAWAQGTVTYTVPSGTTSLAIRLQSTSSYGAAYKIYFDLVELSYTAPVAKGAPTCFAEFNGVRYFGCGKFLCKLNSAGSTLSAVGLKQQGQDVYGFAGDVTDLEVFTDGLMYIGQEGSQVIEDCEDAWTNGTNGTASLDTGDYKVGSGACKIVGSSVVAGDIIAYEPITSLNLKTFTGVKLWIKSSATVAAGDLCLILSDTADCSSSDDIISLPALTAGIWTRVYAKQADPSANTAILAVGLEYNANAADTTIHIDDIEAESSYYYMDSGENLTQSTLAVATIDSFAKFFVAVGTTLWKGVLPNRLHSATNPSNLGAANWSGVTTVDTPNYDILELLTNGTTLVIKKKDRTFYYDGTNILVLIGETQHLAGDTSGRCATEWQKKYYIGCGTQSLVEYDAGTITWRSPAKFCTNLHEFVGKVNAVAGDEEYLFAIVDNDTDGTVEVLAGRSETIDSTTGWVWHPYQRITLTACGGAWVSSVSQKRLWIASTSSSESLHYIPLPSGYGNVASDANRAFATDGYFITPKHHANFKGDQKSFIKITAELGHAYDADIYFECHYKKLEDSSWTDAGDLKGSATSRIATLYFPVDASSNKPTSRTLQLKFVGKTDDTTKTPILLNYDIRGILYSTRRRIIRAMVHCADDVVDKLGSVVSADATTIKTALEEAADATWPVEFYDIFGATKNVRLLATPEYIRVIKEEGKNPELAMRLMMQEIALS